MKTKKPKFAVKDYAQSGAYDQWVAQKKRAYQKKRRAAKKKEEAL